MTAGWGLVVAHLLTAVAALIGAWWARGAHRQGKATHELVNSRMTELLTAARLLATLEGQAEMARKHKSDPCSPSSTEHNP
jgi:hypothetical protein